MTTETNEPPATTVLLWAVGIIAIGYFGYTKMFPSDLSQVRSCISTMVEASRGEVGYGELRQALVDVDAAAVVVISNMKRIPMGGQDIVTIDYVIDGRRRSIMCAR